MTWRKTYVCDCCESKIENDAHCKLEVYGGPLLGDLDFCGECWAILGRITIGENRNRLFGLVRVKRGLVDRSAP